MAISTSLMMAITIYDRLISPAPRLQLYGSLSSRELLDLSDGNLAALNTTF
ncbi:hypothetical protein E4U57_004953 [Claviceps arundinis]|uniref:Uncharacterized protein n=1 Tax=Claviceps arundinis TaxID=1623583 RepID=A0ABQ7PIM8_9HYPO|nr:hypothetical protein E4U57_004953 [Claviceps arundinis]